MLGRLNAAYGPCPDRPQKPVVLVLDNGPIHTRKASRAALVDELILRKALGWLWDPLGDVYSASDDNPAAAFGLTWGQ